MILFLLFIFTIEYRVASVFNPESILISLITFAIIGLIWGFLNLNQIEMINIINI